MAVHRRKWKRSGLYNMLYNLMNKREDKVLTKYGLNTDILGDREMLMGFIMTNMQHSSSSAADEDERLLQRAIEESKQSSSNNNPDTMTYE